MTDIVVSADRTTFTMEIIVDLSSPRVTDSIAFARHINLKFQSKAEPWQRYSAKPMAGDRAFIKLIFDDLTTRLNAGDEAKGALTKAGRLKADYIGRLEASDPRRTSAKSILAEILALPVTK
jgi:hypothetical protein